VNRGYAKSNLGDMKSAYSDWTKTSGLGDEDAARWVKEYCQ